MAIGTVNRQVPRYATLIKGRNSRFPASQEDAPARIELCDTSEDVAKALQRAVSDGLRPTVRSGGHCYEDFVYNNPGGAVLDLMFNDMLPVPEAPKYRIAGGAQLGEVYTNLFKRYNVTIPGGTCSSVGAGGHICGGGYGLLSRLHGVTSDWLTAVDILTVDGGGNVVARRIDQNMTRSSFGRVVAAGIGICGECLLYFL